MALKDVGRNPRLEHAALHDAFVTCSPSLHWNRGFVEAFALDPVRVAAQYETIGYTSTLVDLFRHAVDEQSDALLDFALGARARFTLEGSQVARAGDTEVLAILDFIAADAEVLLGRRTSSDDAFDAMLRALGPGPVHAHPRGGDAINAALRAGRTALNDEALAYMAELHTLSMYSFIGYGRVHGRDGLAAFLPAAEQGRRRRARSPFIDTRPLAAADVALFAGRMKTVVRQRQRTADDPAACAAAAAPFDAASAAVLFAAAGDDASAHALSATREAQDAPGDTYASVALGDYGYAARDRYAPDTLFECLHVLLHHERLRARFAADHALIRAEVVEALKPAADALAALAMPDDKDATAHLKACLAAVSKEKNKRRRDEALGLMVRIAAHRELPFYAYKCAQKMSAQDRFRMLPIAARGYAAKGDVDGALQIAARAGDRFDKRMEHCIALAALRELQGLPHADPAI